MEDLDSQTGEISKSLVALSIRDRVEDEKCVVAQYRTSVQQKNTFTQLLSTCSRNSVPIEWVIDIADESNGWFYGTAYHFDDSTQMLHVMVPDKENPTFDGHVLLDHRTVHLIECADGKSDALFNQIVRDSVIKVKWEVEWFDEAEDGTTGSWIRSSARYYIRIANQILVKDDQEDPGLKGFIIIVADLNLRLLNCHKDRGIEEFQRLINEGVVQSSPEAAEMARLAVSPVGSPAQTSAPSQSLNREESTATRGSVQELGSPGGGAGNNINSLTLAGKLADMSTGLRECVVDVLDDRDRMKAENSSLADMFSTFALDGDLDAGMKLLTHFEGVKAKTEKLRLAQASDAPAEESDDDKIEAIADDAIFLAQKLERNLVKIVRAGGEISTSAEDEIETLRRSLRKARSELDAKEEELQRYRTTTA